MKTIYIPSTKSNIENDAKGTKINTMECLKLSYHPNTFVELNVFLATLYVLIKLVKGSILWKDFNKQMGRRGERFMNISPTCKETVGTFSTIVYSK